MLEDFVDIVISAFPFLQGFVSTAQVVITALPSGGIPGIAGALGLFLFLFGGDYLLNEEDED